MYSIVDSTQFQDLRQTCNIVAPNHKIADPQCCYYWL